ncbi:hypothetical protein [Okeania hirsuta]|uniref:hypothetical protein n=1 Tax=Okeania hirsuta TaxID=1458930 RepID=UPI0030DC0507
MQCPYLKQTNFVPHAFWELLYQLWGFKILEEGDRRQETGDRRKITWGFSPQVILNTV